MTNSYLIPQFFERRGRVSNTSFTFDTTLYTFSSGGQGAAGQLDLTLFAQNGQPIKSATGQVVCNPCSFSLPSSPPNRTIAFEPLFVATGGIKGTGIAQGFGVIEVTVPSTASFNSEVDIINTHKNTTDISQVTLVPSVIPPTPGPQGNKGFVLPHILEKQGRVSNTQFTFDTTIFANYVSGLAGTADGGGATMELYLFDQATGQPMQGTTGTVCNPCGPSDVNATHRKLSIRIDDLITNNGGGFDKTVKLGFGVIVVGGNDPDGVNLQGFVVNSHTGPFDLSVFGFEPQPIRRRLRRAGPDYQPKSAPALPSAATSASTSSFVLYT